VVYDYVPATAAVVTGQNNKVETTNCLKCHVLFRANAANAGGAVAFHSGQRYEAQYCILCHNDQRKYSGTAVDGGAPGEVNILAEPPILTAATATTQGTLGNNPGKTNISVFRGEAVINIPVFAHKIHRGKELGYTGTYTAGNIFPEVGYPQDLRNCDTCHAGAAKADNWKTAPSRRACGSCHDKVDFTLPHPSGLSGIPRTDDSKCADCHNATTIPVSHTPVAPPDPNSTKSGGTNANTNASYLGNVTKLPAGARAISYDLNAVTTVDAGAGYVFPVVKFRFLENDAGVVFNAFDGGASAELIDGFVGGPSVYCVYALPQDGVAEPADFNGSTSVYLKNNWKTTVTPVANNGTFAGPVGGYYTTTLTAQALPTTAKMLTCGLGYSYSLASTPPLVQVTGAGSAAAIASFAAAYAYNTTTQVGGLSVPAQNVWKVATGYTGRRNATSSASPVGQIVQTSKCADCHDAQLGNTPSYHAGQRNDAASCSWCHTSNRTSSGWSAGSESFLHGIHAAGVRNTPFNWHATSLTVGFYETSYPGRLQYCESCHQAGYFDFSNSWYTGSQNGVANVDRRLYQTVATGAIAPDAIAVSPYVKTDGTNYGAGYTTPLDAGVPTPVDAAGTTLVNSPITNVCFSCHDGKDAQTHFRLNGGSVYQPRTAALASTEACLICHGPGKLAAIKDIHYK
jgi:OmcA/MtrC family decaheme c-type cytochrome